MTVAAPTLVEQEADLLRELNDVRNRHAVGGAFRLLFVPQELDLGADEVLVQEVDAERRIVELRPTLLVDVDLGTVLHGTQTVDLDDDGFAEYAAQPTAGDCYASTLNGQTSHHYVL